MFCLLYLSGCLAELSTKVDDVLSILLMMEDCDLGEMLPCSVVASCEGQQKVMSHGVWGGGYRKRVSISIKHFSVSSPFKVGFNRTAPKLFVLEAIALSCTCQRCFVPKAIYPSHQARFKMSSTQPGTIPKCHSGSSSRSRLTYSCKLALKMPNLHVPSP